MRIFVLSALALLLGAPAVAADSPTHSPYAGEESREIKALAPDFIKGLKAGAGLGFAKSAELNGYPGPAHLLELETKIPLNAEQTRAIIAIRDEMRRASIALGDQLLNAEAALEAAFRDRAISQVKLSDLTLQAGALHAQLRAAHLGAHIQATALLMPQKIHRYQVLRGYAGNDAGGHKDGGHKGSGHKGGGHTH